MNLNGPLIRERRRQLGLSQRMLSKALGTTGTLGRRIEQSEDNLDVTLLELERLADVLRLHPFELLVVPDRPAPPQAEVAVTAKLGSLLAKAEVSVPIAALAAAFGITIAETTDALTVLDHQLRSSGLRVAVFDEEAQLVSAGCDGFDTKSLQKLTRRAKSRSHVTAPEAKILYQVMQGALTPKKAFMSNDGRVAVRKLLNAGLIDPPGGDLEPLKLSRDVAESLLPDCADLPAHLSDSSPDDLAQASICRGGTGISLEEGRSDEAECQPADG